MTKWEKTVCPICKRLVAVSDIQGIAHAHADKVGNPCPMSGQRVA